MQRCPLHGPFVGPTLLIPLDLVNSAIYGRVVTVHRLPRRLDAEPPVHVVLRARPRLSCCTCRLTGGLAMAPLRAPKKTLTPLDLVNGAAVTRCPAHRRPRRLDPYLPVHVVLRVRPRMSCCTTTADLASPLWARRSSLVTTAPISVVVRRGHGP